MAQQAVQAAAEFGCLDLVRIARADGGDAIGERQAALDQRKLAVELQRVRRPPVRRQAQRVGVRARHQPLVGEVVDGEDGLGARCFQAEQGRQQAGLPIVRVHHVGVPVWCKMSQCECRCSAAKQRKPGRVVRPVLAIDVLVGVAGALEGRRLYQVNRQRAAASGRQFALQQGQRCAVQGAAGNRTSRGQGRQGGRVGRQYQPRIHTDGAQRARQGADHVAQATGLDEWVRLAGRQQDAQAPAHGSSSTSAASGGRFRVIDHG